MIEKTLTMHSISPTENKPSFVTSAHRSNNPINHLIQNQELKKQKQYEYVLEDGPLRFTPKCFSNASSISREPRIIQGVVPHTKRWYFPTCKRRR